MSFFKIFSFIAFIILNVFFSSITVQAQEAVSVTNQVIAEESERVAPTVYMFVRDDCKHCKDAKAFLESISEEVDFGVRYYDIYNDEYKQLFESVAESHSLVKGTPITMINGVVLQGYADDETTGETFLELLEKEPVVNKSFEDVQDGGAEVATGLSIENVCTEESCTEANTSYEVPLPFINKTIDVGSFSLPTLSLTLGLIDGFNPCALWVLIMFLMVLSQAGSRKKMMQFAGLFIFAEAIMYYLILTVWFKAWDFVGLNKIVTIFVGLLAVGSGIYFLYKFKNFQPVCSVSSIEQQRSMSAKVKNLAKKPFTLGVALGILGLAFSVNIFEFACSIGIPQTYTAILELNALTWIERQAQMFLYILGYMFDDFLVFGLALYGMDKINNTYKYSKWSTLIGGILMILLGLIMLLKPELLVF